MKKFVFAAALIFTAAVLYADFAADFAEAEKNFSVGNYMEALRLYKKADSQKSDEKAKMYIEFIENKLKNNPGLAGKPAVDPATGRSEALAPVVKPKYEDGWSMPYNLASAVFSWQNANSSVFAFRYETMLGGYNSIGGKFSFGYYRFNGVKFDTYGGGIEYRFFPLGRAPHSLYAGASAEVRNISAKLDTLLFAMNIGSAAIVQINGMTGYRWVLDNGAVFDLSASAGYMTESGIPYDIYSYEYGGLLYDVSFGIGYAW
jgi:hypothetical protein